MAQRYYSDKHIFTSRGKNPFIYISAGPDETLVIDAAITGSIVGSTLPENKIVIGNASNVAEAYSISGDATMSNTGVLTLEDTSVVAGSYISPNITIDSKGRITFAENGNTFLSDNLTDSHIYVGNVLNKATDVAMSGDATISNTGAITLASVGTNNTIALPTSITNDYAGRITAISNTLNSGRIIIGNSSHIASVTTISGDATLSDIGVLSLKVQAGLSAGSYKYTDLTVNEKGIITAISDGALGTSTEMLFNNAGTIGSTSGITYDGADITFADDKTLYFGDSQEGRILYNAAGNLVIQCITGAFRFFSNDTTSEMVVRVGTSGDRNTAFVVSQRNNTRMLTLTADANITHNGYNSRKVDITTITGTDTTYTMSQMWGGFIKRNAGGTNRNDTSDTAANIVAGFNNAVAGVSFEFILENTTATTGTITLNAGSGVTLVGDMIVYENSRRKFLVLTTNVGAGTEAVSIYDCGIMYDDNLTIGGSDTQIQYNNSGNLGGISSWTTNGSTNISGLDNASIILGTSSDFSMTHNGTSTLLTNNTGNLVLDNTATNGSISMIKGTDTDITGFEFLDNSLNPITVFQNSRLLIYKQLQSSSGTALLPQYSFSSDSNTGMYNVSADALGFSTNGTLRTTIGTTSITNTLVSLGPNGTLAAPTYSFSGETNTGIYKKSVAVIGVGTGGVERLEIGFNNVTCNLPFIADTLTSTNYYSMVQGDGAQSISDGGSLLTNSYWDSGQTVLVDTEETAAVWNGANGRYTIAIAGIYYISYNVFISSNSTGIRAGYLDLNGSASYANVYCQPVNGDRTGISSSIVMKLAVNDELKVGIVQNTGGSLNMDTALLGSFILYRLA